MNDSITDKAQFSDTVHISKSYQTSVLIEGKEVPIIHQWGKKGLSKYPRLRVDLAKAVAKFSEKVFGVPNINNERLIGTETLIVEKFDEVYHPGIGADAVNILAQKGYGFRQIAAKIGKPVLKEINITHAIKSWKPGWLNLMLNEGIDEIFDLITETNAVDYYTNTLARGGVGDSTTAAMATDTGLIGGSSAFQAMEGGFPNLATAQRVDFKSSFASGLAEFAWEEFTIDNAAGPNANLQRLVTPKGTKSTGETWTMEIQITGS